MRFFWVLGSGVLCFDVVIVRLEYFVVVIVIVVSDSGLLYSGFVRCWMDWLEFGAAVLQLEYSGSECLHSEVEGFDVENLDFACLCCEPEHFVPGNCDLEASRFACLDSARSCSRLYDCLDIE